MRFQYQLVTVIICVGSLGCGSDQPVNEPVERMVFVDTETMNAVVQPVSKTLPAVNPQTGQRTLMPGLYCPDCSTWHPVPAPDQINRRPDTALCPKTRIPLIADGPWPNEDTASAEDDP